MATEKKQKAKADERKVFPLTSVKGMHDILPDAMPLWERVRRAAHDVASYYNFREIRTPLIEHAELYTHSVGEATDIIEKQMFSLRGRGKEKLVLRPEATAGIARAYIEHGMSQLGMPLKLYTEGPMFRYEQPQAGRFRQFHQIECDILSVEDDPIYDVQVILVLMRFLEATKVKRVCVSLNSIGCKQCRPGYRKELSQYYRGKRKAICPDCVRRLAANPLRLLDCKKEKCIEVRKGAPIMIDHLCAHCHDHFKKVLEYLDELKIPYQLNHYLVRGLDYYTKTVFEVALEEGGVALGGGGRYDYLIETLGGKPTPGVGWAVGVERIIAELKAVEGDRALRVKPKLSFVYIGELAKKRSLVLIEELRKHRIDVTESLGRESLKGQLRTADKLASPLALIFGQKEAFEETILIRDLQTGIQETVPLAKMIDAVKKKMQHKS